MTADAQAVSPADLSSLPTCTLSASQLGDLELLLSGALAPLTGFMTMADAVAVGQFWQLADGTPFPAVVTLDVPAAALPAAVELSERLLLADPEGTPIAVLTIRERTALGPDMPQADALHPMALAGPAQTSLVRLAGPVSANRVPEHGPFRRLMLTPAASRAELDDGPVLAFATRSPLTSRQIGQIKHLAGQLKARVLILPLVGGHVDVVGTPQALIRSVLAAMPSLPPGARVVPVPLPPRPGFADGRARELALQARVAAAYGATHLMADGMAPDPADLPAGADLAASAAIPIVPSGDWAYDPRAEVWRPHALIEAGTEQEDLSADQLGDLLDAGTEIPPWVMPAAVARELRRVRRPRSQRGLVLFLTGLSGSGKSTIARDLADVLTERSDRQVSLLDGDLVRQLLSAGLTFSRADRDLNIARIGFVAAEIARHGGIAICAPIAPFAAARAQVRQMVSETGDFFLVYVATPVEVCESRDRKGLYAKARAGLIGQFTGVSDPYEVPTDAELVIDTSVVGRSAAVRAVLTMLTSGGWLAEQAPPDR
ncbi:MAG TPA: adenylyl-sulfate kinase [Streptosporangiaceae bacterium]|nr:adenylyl-sulfate kinase [Streptosporangiaceae bacterium]